MLENKKIVLGITGGIAAYKAAELTRRLVKAGAHVKIIMTKSALEFITPLTMQTLSQNRVYTDMFASDDEYDMAHIALAEFADAFVVAPATANIIGKIASGIGDDLLSTTIMAENKPTLICPAMNDKMLANPIVQDNIRRLKKNGYAVMDSAVGELACKTEGKGRLPEIDAILAEIENIMTPQDLAGVRILITAGPTEEPLDPVRFITNLSSGKMGYALASAAQRRGARVTLVSGPTSLPLPPLEKIVTVRTAREMHKAVLQHYKSARVIIKAAAVADYRPKIVANEKIKKEGKTLFIELERNPDIIAEIGKKKGNRILVGFAMETQNLLTNARGKLVKKNMDMIVANNLRQEGAGFRTDTNIITVIDRAGKTESLEKMTKIDAAGAILNRIKKLISEKSKGKK
ncbi:MAG TPA: bifunctional phosphopantothenoylcysteine decarboxylase/phosphopantothenate--cysteine ligase CoaBC [Smithella sp.]|jgi:phosphopantothenoylcysteine decarboxylase/phosphopantothenate--cysteine ligase|nr:bifunctional phosphopantothenoylcysteine decarboxylase/phosphopantothenate--cysteine ligase CoaBC [Smithella sp.]OQC53129.1 MAG: Coenzyme A biosynthesis bifunctional protein CoaBC [Deltaproteobacteria bacterium ADurb.Bin022]HNQ64852.1 bifunctional phosphopantothenoylcysteine decarboxylase/phosphopantothenate--cysteine ligase CoaBC [Smithella sp.]HOE32751.1 bifunctional phosphopantothenoylcysteine decarboxylase/phosphopantothenate--cysteine ligase CoaBC [Smithella sp.]HOG08935.1 bifunctional 